MLQQLESQVGKLGEDGILAKMKSVKDQVAIAFITPLMQRVHRRVPQCAELMFMDASGCMDRQNWRVFMLMTHSCAGGLPIGCLITTSEAKEVIQVALELFISMLDSECFFGRGTLGPNVILPDDSAAERAALQATFPSANSILCIFHVLQAFWRYVWDGKNDVKRINRPHVFGLMKKMVYANTEEEIDETFGEVLEDGIVQRCYFSLS